MTKYDHDLDDLCRHEYNETQLGVLTQVVPTNLQTNHICPPVCIEHPAQFITNHFWQVVFFKYGNHLLTINWFCCSSLILEIMIYHGQGKLSRSAFYIDTFSMYGEDYDITGFSVDWVEMSMIACFCESLSGRPGSFNKPSASEVMLQLYYTSTDTHLCEVASRLAYTVQ